LLLAVLNSLSFDLSDLVLFGADLVLFGALILIQT